MIDILRKHKRFFILIFIIIIGGFLRFYKLDWGQGLYAHPDEYHIVGSVAQLSFPTQMHPHFFSYGTVTIYLIYLTQELLNFFFSSLNPSSPAGGSELLIPNSFILGRFYSALFSTLTIIIVYKICRSFMERRFSYLAAFLVALTPGLIQQAHFATPESALTFFLLLSLSLIMKFLKSNKIFYLILASVSLGFALGVKISSIVFLLPLTITILLKSYSKNASLLKNAVKMILKFIGLALVSLMVTIATFVLVAPYVFLDYQAFRSNVDYEGGLAIGKIPVFYTRQFINTISVLFHIEKILPYALGPVLLISSAVGFFLLIFNLIKKPKLELIILFVAFITLFISSSFLFAKWTRFIVPTLPFFAILTVFFLQELKSIKQALSYSSGVFLLFATMLWTMAFFSIYTSPDVRIAASKWLESHTKPGSNFLVEGGNTVDLPLDGSFQRISLDFYALEEDPLTREKIIDALYSSDYFLVQSRRIFYNHQRLRSLYPKTSNFYDALFNGQVGFEQIKEFHSYPKLSLFGFAVEFPDERAEETWSVFDHPVIRVFKKNKQLSQDQYRYIVSGGRL